MTYRELMGHLLAGKRVIHKNNKGSNKYEFLNKKGELVYNGEISATLGEAKDYKLYEEPKYQVLYRIYGTPSFGITDDDTRFLDQEHFEVHYPQHIFIKLLKLEEL